jgi:hypothetical protein
MTATSILEEIRSLVVDLPLEERLQLIREIASIGLSGEQASPSLSQKNTTIQRKAQLLAEQNNWFARPAHERRLYAGQYVAIYQGEVVDSDVDQRQLYLRVRKRFGHQSVLLIHADLAQTPVYTIHSPQVIR